jgi:hypothetical protein
MGRFVGHEREAGPSLSFFKQLMEPGNPPFHCPTALHHEYHEWTNDTDPIFAKFVDSCHS